MHKFLLTKTSPAKVIAANYNPEFNLNDQFNNKTTNPSNFNKNNQDSCYTSLASQIISDPNKPAPFMFNWNNAKSYTSEYDEYDTPNWNNMN